MADLGDCLRPICAIAFGRRTHPAKARQSRWREYTKNGRGQWRARSEVPFSSSGSGSCGGQPGSTAPEEPPQRTMPANHRLGSHDGDGVPQRWEKFGDGGQGKRSRRLSLGRGAPLLRMMTCWRSNAFSAMSSARPRKRSRSIPRMVWTNPRNTSGTSARRRPALVPPVRTGFLRRTGESREAFKSSRCPSLVDKGRELQIVTWCQGARTDRLEPRPLVSYFNADGIFILR